MKWRTNISVFILVLCSLPFWLRAEECTTGLARPECVANGRSLLWKNRDSSNRPNAVHLFRHGEFTFLGLINAGDTTQVWAGINQYGFAIMNAEALDMAVPGEETGYDDEGVLMKTVLGQCQTVQDFAVYLDTTNAHGRKVTSNFGVIDAHANAAFFEVGNHEYYRFDANPAEGCWAVRANFAFRARSKEGYGQVRYQRAVDLLRRAAAKKNLSAEYILRQIATDIHLPDTLKSKAVKGKTLITTQQTINRHRTVACAVFEVPPEAPALATFWIILGEPATALALPLWVAAGVVPQLVDSAGYAPTNRLFTQIRAYAYPDTAAPQYVDTERLIFIQKYLKAAQSKIFKATARRLQQWQTKPPTSEEMVLMQNQMADIAYRASQNCLRKLSQKYPQPTIGD